MHYIILIIIGLAILGFAIEYYQIILTVIAAIIIFKLFSWKGLLIAGFIVAGTYLFSVVKDKIKNPEKYFSDLLDKTSKQLTNTKDKIVNTTHSAQKEISNSGIFTKEYWKNKIFDLLFAKAITSVNENYNVKGSQIISFNMFEISMLPLHNHPIRMKNSKFKARWLYVLTVFVKKYSDCKWSNDILNEYYSTCFKTNNMLPGIKKSIPENVDIRMDVLKLFLTCGLKKNKFYKQLLIDLLFVCNAIDNKDKGDLIFSAIVGCYFKKNEKLINDFYKSLYEATEKSMDSDCEFVWYWHRNKTFLRKQRKQVLIAANMSAGKSTLINAIVGKKVNQTQSESCTKKIHYIFNKAYSDGRHIKCDGSISLNTTLGDLLRSNENNKTNYIHVGTSFINSQFSDERMLLIDTPGVNSYADPEHQIMTEQEISKNKANVLVYVMNATNIGTDDENKQLFFIQENFKGKIIFVVNKLDQYKPSEDNVSDTINKVKQDLIDKGFESPRVVPISAYAAYLSKMKLSKVRFDEDEQDEFERISRKMKKEEYQFNAYYPENVQTNIKAKMDNVAMKVLFHSGVLQLEEIIKQEIQ